MTTIVQLIEERDLKIGWQIVSLGDMIAYSVLVISPFVSLLHLSLCAYMFWIS